MRSRLLVVILMLVALSQSVAASAPDSSGATPQTAFTVHFPISAHVAVLGRPALDFGMVLIPAGEFIMGCDMHNFDDECIYDSELPTHRVWLSSYWIDRYEVTNEQYEVCVVAGTCTPPAHDWLPQDYPERPVHWVDWHQAAAYCTWAGKRLPTEAEWEKAARGSTDTRRFPWGEQWPDCTRANFIQEHDPSEPFTDYQCVGHPVRVGSYPTGASPYGVMDMAGNVREWVADWYEWDYYRHSPYVDPTGPPTGEFGEWGDYKGCRGGGYWDYPWWLRVAFRDSLDPDEPRRHVGIRCAGSAE
jgi:formylglycine-generating enzyme required for sulfatase activity